MKRIHISHEIGGVVPWAILLLLLAVETGPIFFKMMLVKGTYDYLLENKKMGQWLLQCYQVFLLLPKKKFSKRVMMGKKRMDHCTFLLGWIVYHPPKMMQPLMIFKSN